MVSGRVASALKGETVVGEFQTNSTGQYKVATDLTLAMEANEETSRRGVVELVP